MGLPHGLADIKERENEDDIQSFTSCPEADESPTQTAEPKIARREDQAVTWLRLGLGAILLAATVTVSLGIYYYMAGIEQNEFEKAFTDTSTKILENFQAVADRRLGTIASFTNSFLAHTLAINATYPFVTIPSFEAQVTHVASLADAVSLSFSVIVEPEDRLRWENEFVPDNAMKWLEESENYLKRTSSMDEEDTEGNATPSRPGGTSAENEEDYEGKPTIGKGGISQQIYTRKYDSSGERKRFIVPNETALVWWQSSPIIPGFTQGFINRDVKDDSAFEGELLTVLRRKRSALGRMTTNSYGAQGNDPPISAFYYPVYTDYSPNARLAGTITTLLNWDTFFTDILPQNVDGLIAVLRNTCDQIYTFAINGPDVVFLGEGDLHDTDFDNMMQDVSFTALINQAVEDGTFKGHPLDEEGCQYFLQVFASSEMKSQFISKMPIYYTIGAVLIFVFTSFLFIGYDRLVERRQNLVEKEALKSGAIVSSLFPAAYKEQLMKEQERRLEKNVNDTLQSSEINRQKLSNLMNGTDDDIVQVNNQIADLYKDCTVLFADISGFTKWSSNRTPNEVFTLLQTLFGRFDQVASRRGVFKVETIGDCYLAVTGLPNAQENHALIMAKFANECMVKMNETIRALADSLGEDTAEDLSLRVGLHSGPVTAGVLRGQKSRFQIFGDTVNTASRMESTGESNRIQVSPSTADILRNKHGKGHWLLPRPDLVQPKGKEAMQTFWLIPEGSVSSHASTVFTPNASKAYPRELLCPKPTHTISNT